MGASIRVDMLMIPSSVSAKGISEIKGAILMRVDGLAKGYAFLFIGSQFYKYKKKGKLRYTKVYGPRRITNGEGGTWKGVMVRKYSSLAFSSRPYHAMIP